MSDAHAAPPSVAAPGAGGARTHRVAAAAAGLLCFAAYGALVAAGPYWLDSSEFAAAAFDLGVAHPPGHPLASLLGKAAALVPLGPVALRVGMLQALCGAVAAALVTLLGAELARRARLAVAALGSAAGASPVARAQDGEAAASSSRSGRGAPIDAGLGLAAGLGFGLSHAGALQAVRPEVYALHAALALYAVLELVRFDDDGDGRRGLRAALALGLALANHHLLALLVGGAAALFVAVQHERVRAIGVWRSLGWALLAVALGLGCYAYLPLRALRHPLVDWGAPSTLERFWWTVSARAFQGSLRHASLGGAPEVALALGRELAWLFPLALSGLTLLLAAPSLRRIGLLLFVGTVAVAAAPALVGFDPDNPDAFGYLEVAVALLSSCAAVAPAALLAWWEPRRASAGGGARGGALAPLVLVAGALLLAVVPGVLRLPRLSLSRFTDTERVAGALLEATPPRGLLVTSYFQTVFPVWYLRAVEGQRPDVDHVHRHFLAWPGYRDELLRRRPELAPLLGPRDLDTAALRALSERRAVRLEYDLDLDPALVPLLVHGELADALGAGGTWAGAPARDSTLLARLNLGEPQTLRFVFWRAFLDAHRDCRLGDAAAARPALARARSLLGGTPDPDLEELARRCGE